jgi:deoxycytidine triphosphate deaminase
MSVLSDKEIREFAEKGMITPFKSSLMKEESILLFLLLATVWVLLLNA